MKNTKIIFKNILSLFAVTILAACNNSSDTKLAYTDKETVKELVSKRESEISWTKEIEPERLISKNTISSEIDNNTLIFTPNIAKILKNYDDPVYPELADFGKLDVSLLKYDVMEKINDFCTLVSDDIYSNADNFLDSSYRFNYVFFRNDLINNWKKNFDTDFPFTEEDSDKLKNKKQKKEQLESEIKSIKNTIENYTQAEETINKETIIKEKSEDKKELDEKNDNKKNTKTEKDTTKSDKNKKQLTEKTSPEKTINEKNKTDVNIKELEEKLLKLEKELEKIDAEIKDEEYSLFSKWILGEPFIGKEIIEIPIRFYCKQGTVDVTLYLNYKKQNSIYQISIDKWGKA